MAPHPQARAAGRTRNRSGTFLTAEMVGTSWENLVLMHVNGVEWMLMLLNG